MEEQIRKIRTAPVRRTRMAPERNENERRKQARLNLKVYDRESRAENYEPLRPDKKKLPLPTPEERVIASQYILEKMKECFGPKGGQLIITKIIKGGENYDK